MMCLRRSNQEDGPGHVQGVRRHMSRHVSGEGKIHEGNEKTAERV